jgi:copper chaperone NosL
MNRSTKRHISFVRIFRTLAGERSYRFFVAPGFCVAALMVSLMALVNCQTRKVEPVALAPEDMCSYCRMAISEKQFAAEVIDKDGQAFKFDDIGCMVNFVEGKKNKSPIAAYFVMDFDERAWIKAEDAFYVRTSEVTTPMNGGLIAFKTQNKAQPAVDKYRGKLLRWKEVAP